MGKSHPIHLEQLPSDLTPDRLPPSLFESTHFVLLESSYSGRYSIAAWEPRAVLTSDGSDFFERLRHALREFPRVDAPNLPFAGGWIGYLGYELYSEIEKKVPPREPDLIPKAVFCYYDRFYLYDHRRGLAHEISLAEGTSPSSLVEPAIRFAPGPRTAGLRSRPSSHRGPKEMRASESFSCAPRRTSPPQGFRSSLTRQSYLQNIETVKKYITAGDCYQVNLSQRIEGPVNRSPHAVYRSLRTVSPSPYAAFLNLGEAQILSSSPESFLEVDGRKVTTRPIKGTRPRGKNAAEDESLRTALLGSSKDRAELLMITDLERNDLGRVCKPGSVVVDDIQRVESYAQVHHLVSTIRGELGEGKEIVDLLKATFPGGSITGAPKIRAMQIIRELEPSPRNVYCGGIGFISQNGKAQFNIAIRTMVYKPLSLSPTLTLGKGGAGEGGQVYFWAGGGIVADSDPEMEYEETLIKAKGMLQALSATG